MSGMNALVVGSSRGIGRSIAVGLANAGAAVVGVARSSDALDELDDEIREGGGQFLGLTQDLGEADAIDEWVDEAWRWRGSIDCLVNAAGVTNRSTALEVTTAEWDQLFDLNLRGAFFLMQALGKRMLASDGGTIVNIASLSGVVSDGAQAVYSASKAAMIRMTSVLANQWAPQIRLNCVSPGWVETEMTSNFLAVDSNRSAILECTPLQRVAAPTEMVGSVLFLLSDMSSFMTGQNLVVDGGWTS
ncbi:MAG: glucose 1-dehydrogenase [Acidimicrobiales bacterium]|jgi:3-oxoacyl-[acyl-carrier protein] reductase|nr:glucose 1-dehydrogenase [Acidimicrobiales bacterium]